MSAAIANDEPPETPPRSLFPERDGHLAPDISPYPQSLQAGIIGINCKGSLR
jgi:hypothetical protein